MALEDLIYSLESLSEFTPESVYEAVSKSTVGFKDLESWIDYNYPATDSYGRKMVHDGGDGIPSISLIPALISIGLIAILRRK